MNMLRIWNLCSSWYNYSSKIVRVERDDDNRWTTNYIGRLIYWRRSRWFLELKTWEYTAQCTYGSSRCRHCFLNFILLNVKYGTAEHIFLNWALRQFECTGLIDWSWIQCAKRRSRLNCLFHYQYDGILYKNVWVTSISTNLCWRNVNLVRKL